MKQQQKEIIIDVAKAEDYLSLHQLSTEQTVIATLINSYREVVSSVEILTEDCFYDPVCREMYQAVMAIYHRGDTPDMILVTEELRERGSDLTAETVTNMCAMSLTVMDIKPHAMILRDYDYRRKMWKIGYELMYGACDRTEKVDSIHSRTKNSLDNLFEDAVVDVITLNEAYRKLQERMLINRSMQEGETYGTPTGFPEVDKNGGLCGSDLIVVGAETSKGKTSFATALSLSAIEHDDGVAFYSMEMRPDQMAARIASMKTGISSKDILFSKLTIEDIYRIDQAMEKVDTSKMYFDSRPKISLASICTSIRALKYKHDIKGAVVDYLQLIDVESLGLTTELATAECARRLKNLALELDIWIIAISQLNRNPQNPVPSLSRLRNSGQIEEAADSIYLIHRTDKKYPEEFADVPVDGTAMVMLAKGRHTGTTNFICGFKPENTLFYPLSPIEVANMKSTLNLPAGDTFMPLDDNPF